MRISASAFCKQMTGIEPVKKRAKNAVFIRSFKIRDKICDKIIISRFVNIVPCIAASLPFVPLVRVGILT